MVVVCVARRRRDRSRLAPARPYGTLAADLPAATSETNGPGSPDGGGADGEGSGAGPGRSGRRDSRPLIPFHRARPSGELLSGESADVYFARAERVLGREGLAPVVLMEFFPRHGAILCGIDEGDQLFR